MNYWRMLYVILVSLFQNRSYSTCHMCMRFLIFQSKEVTFKGHTDSVDQLCWRSKHPDLLATASGDKTVRMWDARTQRSVEVFNTKGENINITWSRDGNYIAVGNKEDLITFIDVRAGKIRQEVPFRFEVNEITFNPDSNLFLMTNGLGYVLVYT